MRLNSSSFRLVMSCVEAEAPREIPARGSAGAALNLRDCPLLPGSGVRGVRVLVRPVSSVLLHRPAPRPPVVILNHGVRRKCGKSRRSVA
jgi:hypothetical protein